MNLLYENKMSEELFLQQPAAATVTEHFTPSDKMLFYGDNVDVMKFLLQHGYAGKVDLVYIDPPFSTNNIFTVGETRVIRFWE